MTRTNTIIYYIKIIRLYIKGIIGSMINSIIKGRKGQSLLEYAIVITVAITAILGMKLYLQRGLQGRYKAAADKAINTIIAAQGTDPTQPGQYDPYYNSSDYITDTESRVTSVYLPEGRSGTVVDPLTPEITSRTGSRTEEPYSD